MKWQRTILKCVVLAPLVFTLTIDFALSAPETRCGWLENPSPGNLWLNDSKGMWVLSTQGSPPVEGIDRIPDLTEGDFIYANGNYGYVCACLNAEFDLGGLQVKQITSLRLLPRSKCTKDKNLRSPQMRR